jgi:hypothetical protein
MAGVGENAELSLDHKLGVHRANRLAIESDVSSTTGEFWWFGFGRGWAAFFTFDL